jgi:hypothetical protein
MGTNVRKGRSEIKESFGLEDYVGRSFVLVVLSLQYCYHNARFVTKKEIVHIVEKFLFIWTLYDLCSFSKFVSRQQLIISLTRKSVIEGR